MNVAVVIPAYEEELTIGTLVSLVKGRVDDVVVVDDGSVDRTSEVARKSGAEVIKHEANRGKGQAISTGLKYSLENGYDAVLLMDGDGQHPPEYIEDLLKPIIDGEADMVIGSRFLEDGKKDIPLYRRFGLFILDFFTNFTSKEKVTDSQSGFRALNKKAIEAVNLDSSKGFHVENDMISQISEKDLEIMEKPVEVRYDVPNSHSKGPFEHGLDVLGRIVTLIGYKKPLLLFGTASLITFIFAGIFGYLGLTFYYTTGNPYTLDLAISGFLGIIGVQLAVAGLTLNVLSEFTKNTE
ncbi:glycosyltransferase family 2 protein [Methanonatronarchaeum sp. AMET-Sl]|uniref:glycosyltransferase family 2 protein n=1 Tax=Methanonatronarchaeum sp. AMET-Sl TaxID=3037654 RepID=UPI00244DF7C2|nr:glycosyltransferase family 2 protein [Methanonatronarchaeum sp. AMET-Sl]WGI17668.1 glycosyltransferase family 2 protein [Methanonatronarchaeum sp. AMET-Sl]